MVGRKKFNTSSIVGRSFKMLKTFVVKGLSEGVVNNDGASLYRKLNGR